MAPGRPSPAGPPVLASLEDLTPELRGCVDVVEALLKANKNISTESAEAARRDSVWDTSKPPPRPAFPEAPTHKDLAVKVGQFSQHLPPSTCAVRQKQNRIKSMVKLVGKKKSKQSKESKRPIKVAQNRRMGSPAFLRARYDGRTHGIDWFWTDSNGKGADARFVDADAKGGSGEQQQGLEAAQAKALSRHDQVMADYARVHNGEHAAYWARCRLLRAVGATPNGQRVTNPTALDFASLVDATLLWPVALASPGTGEALGGARQTLSDSIEAGADDGGSSESGDGGAD